MTEHLGHTKNASVANAAGNARGMTVREIQGHLQEMYGAGVSPSLISTVTDVVMRRTIDRLGLDGARLIGLAVPSPGSLLSMCAHPRHVAKLRESKVAKGMPHHARRQKDDSLKPRTVSALKNSGTTKQVPSQKKSNPNNRVGVGLASLLRSSRKPKFASAASNHYLSSDSTDCACWLAWANMAVEAC
jgi:hypothetical protein